MVEHHLDDSTILQYASGDLDEAFTVVVAAHVAMCDSCRQAVRLAEEVGGSMMDTVETAELSAGSVEQVLLKLDSKPSREEPIARKTVKGDVPLPLQRFVGAQLDDVRWKVVAPGVRKHNIKQTSSSGSSLYMLHIAPGTAVPEHGHGGAELTLILAGTYTDAFGAFRRGDIADLDEHVEHKPFVEGDVPCICLVATEAPTRFKGFVARLLQPLTGI